MQQKITIYVLTCDRPGILKTHLDWLRLHLSDFQVKIMDNSSNVTEVVKLQQDYPEIEFNIAGKRLSYAKNFYRCIRDCDTEYMICLHDDDRLVPEVRQHFEKFIKSGKLVGAVNGYFYDFQNAVSDGLVIKHALPGEIKSVFEYSKIKYRIRGGCIPFSPIIFKSEFLKEICENIEFLENTFQQSIDVAILIKILSVTPIYYENEPLYLCGVHKDQDSKYMTASCEENVRKFFIQNLSITERVLFKYSVLIHDSFEMVSKIKFFLRQKLSL